MGISGRERARKWYACSDNKISKKISARKYKRKMYRRYKYGKATRRMREYFEQMRLKDKKRLRNKYRTLKQEMMKKSRAELLLRSSGVISICSMEKRIIVGILKQNI